MLALEVGINAGTSLVNLGYYWSPSFFPFDRVASVIFIITYLHDGACTAAKRYRGVVGGSSE
jgi:hypothetical protein